MTHFQHNTKKESMLLYSCCLHHTLTGIHRIIDKKMRPLLTQRADFQECIQYACHFGFFLV